jgi:hypothetical protein
MLTFAFNMFKIIVKVVSLLKFIFYCKALNLYSKAKIYCFVLLYNNILKLNSTYIAFFKCFSFGAVFKYYYSALLERLNFVHNFKKSLLSFNILYFFSMFNMLKMYKSAWFYIFHHSKNRKNYELLCANVNGANKAVYCKFSSVFIVLNYWKKNKKSKKQVLNNLFSLFFYNLLVYFIVIYLFVYWLNNLLSKAFYVNDFFLKIMLKHNKNLFYYKANFSCAYSNKNKKKEYKEKYFLKKLKLNKFYLIYNKLNLLNFSNIF